MRANSGFYAHALIVVCRKMDVRFGITIRQQPASGSCLRRFPRRTGRPSPTAMDGGADVAETTYTLFQGRPRSRPSSAHRPAADGYARVPTVTLSPATAIKASSSTETGKPWNWRPTIAAMLEIENPIRDLKDGVSLNHLPSGRFPANGAWLAVQVLAHNLSAEPRASVWTRGW